MKSPKPNFKKGDKVLPIKSCVLERDEAAVFTVLGEPVWQDQWWVPVNDPREEDPTFFKAHLLEKVT